MAKVAREFKRVVQETWRNRPRDKVRRIFEKMEEMPDFLRQTTDLEMKLRDYQLEGLNWLLHAWSKFVSNLFASILYLSDGTLQSWQTKWDWVDICVLGVY
jgi:SNF2 family DNA or RNA helicase